MHRDGCAGIAAHATVHPLRPCVLRRSPGGRFPTAQQLRPRQVMELDEIDAIARMVENGLGVALLPRAGLWLREPARVRVIELGALEFQRELVMVSRSGSAQDDLVGEFRRALLAGDGGSGGRADHRVARRRARQLAEEGPQAFGLAG
ncbi:LysR substrate-binding domain-containing protein [Pseudomonas aeruginosa]|nr:LysR substrate-binding domain-containing protein [Pseudomonas aeruginosa]